MTAPREVPRPLLLAVAAITALKLGLLLVLHAWNPGVILNPDTATYVKPARALLEAGTFSPSPQAAPEPEVNRTPGYPAVIAASFGLFGERLLPLSILNVLLSAGSALLVFLLARPAFGERAAAWATLLVLLEPGSLHHSSVVLSETPFTFLLVASLLFLCRALRDPGRAARLALASGTLLSLATLVRPISYYLVVLLSGASAVWAFRHARRGLLAFAVPCALLVGGWQLRNGLATGSYLFSHGQNIMLRFCHAAAVTARVEGTSLPEAQEKAGWRELLYRFGYVDGESEVFGSRRYADLHPETSRLTNVELSERWRREAVEIFRRHPGWAVEEKARGALCLLFTPPAILWAYQYGLFQPGEAFFRPMMSGEPLKALALLPRESAPLFVFSLATLVILVALYALALVGLRRRAGPAPETPLLLLTLVYLVAVSAAPNATDDRYRVPLVPLVAVFAGAGLERLRSRAA